MTTTAIKTNKGETLNITKGKSLRWHSVHACGLSKRFVWHDENGGMWVKANGKYIEARYRAYGFYGDKVDENAVEPARSRRFAYEMQM